MTFATDSQSLQGLFFNTLNTTPFAATELPIQEEKKVIRYVIQRSKTEQWAFSTML